MRWVIVILCLFLCSSSNMALGREIFAPDQILIKLTPESVVIEPGQGTLPDLQTESLLVNRGVDTWTRVLTAPALDSVTGLNRWFLLKFDREIDIWETVDLFSSMPEVESAEPNYFVYPCDLPNDPRYANQYHWELLNAPLAWDISHGSPDVVVAVIDSGSDFGHEDLTTSFWLNLDDPVDGMDNDLNGFIDDYYGWDFRGDDNDPDNVQNDNLHGTHVAGIIGAVTNNGIGVASGTWGCPVMTCKVFPDTASGGALVGDVADAIHYAADNGAAVINMSLGSNYNAQVQADACLYAYNAGVAIFAASGNGGDDGIGDPEPHYPAACEGVIGVGSTTQLDIKDGSSNYGTWVDLYASGVNIISTEPADTYHKESGTSMASPVAASLAALLLSEYPGITHDEILIRMQAGCVDINQQNPAFWNELNPGRINYYYSMVDSPFMDIKTIVVQDPTGTNQNHEADSGETVDLDVFLMNHSWKAGTNIALQVLSATGASIVDGTATYGNFASKEWKKNGDPLRLTVNTGTHTSINLEFRVTADGGYSRDISIALSCNNSYPQIPGFPFYTLGGFNAGSKVGDIDNDGKNEIVCASNDGMIHAWEMDGSYVAGFPVNQGCKQQHDRITFLSAPALADLDLDGYLEILITAFNYDAEYINPSHPDWGTNHRSMGKLFAINHDGTSLPGFPVTLETDFVPSADPPNYSDIKCSPAVADVTGDTHPEIFFGSYNNMVYGYKSDGTLLPGWPRDVLMDVFATPAIADVDHDGSMEIVIATKADVEPLDSGSIYIFDAYGSIKYGPFAAPNQVYSSPVLFDIDTDLDLEIIFGYGDFANVLPDHGVMAIHHNGTVVTGWPADTSASIYGAPAIGDVDEDGLMEVVVADMKAKVYAFNMDGTAVTNFPVQTSTNPDPVLASISSSPAIADLDGSGGPEIVVGSAEGYLYIVHNNGNFMTGTPLVLDVDGFASPTIADIDQDGDIEILMNSRSAFIYNLSGTYDPDQQYWTSFHGNNCNTGYQEFEQVFSGVRLLLPDNDLVAGDLFDLNCLIGNATGSPEIDVDLFIVLDVMSYYWFYPGWTQEIDWQDITTLNPGIINQPILTFEWPAGNFGTASDLRFWGAIVDSSSSLFGDYDMITFGYH